MPSSDTTTRGIRVIVETKYDPTRSSPQQSQWFFLYTVRITNEGTSTAQLLTRHWIITDASNTVEEVKGLGVVGRQPVLEPGEAYEYTSLCRLRTPFGSMHGSYQMVTAGGERFDAAIAPFGLSAPYTVH